VAAFGLWRLAAVPTPVAEAAAAAARGLTSADAELVVRATGLGPALVAQVRALAVAEPQPRLVFYSPYGGAPFELDAHDPRGEPARQTRILFERGKNLLYPTPRDVHFARDAAELQGLLRADLAGRFLVVDGTQGPEPLAVGGHYELLGEQTAPVRLRVWRWQGAR
jgi:hypothetical protein